ncbi:MAG: DegT/DnrJ/EryC1/StrS family aminotransferase [Armatimonadetes bacterium]|nr:DegT/DnrJ/EryC1/StrS family aminotransferase [Armatimonadota bacterium]
MGNLCDTDAFVGIVKRRGLTLVEACSQPTPPNTKEKFFRTIGDISCFSLRRSEHIATDSGGICVADNEDFAAKARLFVDEG